MEKVKEWSSFPFIGQTKELFGESVEKNTYGSSFLSPECPIFILGTQDTHKLYKVPSIDNK